MPEFRCHRCGEELTGPERELVDKIQLHYDRRHGRHLTRRTVRLRLRYGASDMVSPDRLRR